MTPTPRIALQPPATIARCDARLASYREALDQGGDPAIIGRWITETSAERTLASEVVTPAARVSRDGTVPAATEAARLVSDLQAAASTLRTAEAAERNRLYDELGIEMTYDPDGRTVRVVGRACSHGACRRDDATVVYMDVTLPLVE